MLAPNLVQVETLAQSPIYPSTGVSPGQIVTDQKCIRWTVLLLWIWIIASQAQFRRREVTELNVIDGQVVFQIGSWLIFFIIAAYLVAKRLVDWSLIRKGPLRWYLAFTCIALFSATYSPAPSLSAFRSLQHITAIIFGASLGRYLYRLHVFSTIFVSITLALVVLGALGMTFGLSWITPPSESTIWSMEPVWRFCSAFGHPTQLATLAGTAALMIPNETSIRSYSHRCLLFVINMSAVALAASRTALAGVAVGILFTVAIRKRLSLFIACCGFLASLIFLIPPANDLLSQYLTRGQTSQEMQSVTGRIPVYEDAWRRSEEHWLLGQGFLANRVLVLDEQGDGQGTTHAHNLILESLSGTGIFGAFCALCALLTLCVMPFRIWAARKHDRRVIREALIIASGLPPIIGVCILDSGFAAIWTPSAFLFSALAARAQASLNAARKERPQEQEKNEDCLYWPARRARRL